MVVAVGFIVGLHPVVFPTQTGPLEPVTPWRCSPAGSCRGIPRGAAEVDLRAKTGPFKKWLLSPRTRYPSSSGSAPPMHRSGDHGFSSRAWFRFEEIVG